MKRLFRVHDGCPEEYCELIVAENEKQAVIIGVNMTNLENDCAEAEEALIYYGGTKVPQKDIDKLSWGAQDINKREEAVMMRDLGWQCDGDSHCQCCGLNSLDGLFPVCEYCEQCSECGCDEDCEEAKALEAEKSTNVVAS